MKHKDADEMCEQKFMFYFIFYIPDHDKMKIRITQDGQMIKIIEVIIMKA